MFYYNNALLSYSDRERRAKNEFVSNLAPPPELQMLQSFQLQGALPPDPLLGTLPPGHPLGALPKPL